MDLLHDYKYSFEHQSYMFILFVLIFISIKFTFHSVLSHSVSFLLIENIQFHC